MASKYFSTLITTIAIFGLISCSDITNISKEQVQESVQMLDGSNSGITEEGNKPMFILNEKLVSIDTIKKLKPEYIESISIIKGETALQKYGKEGQHGVVKIHADAKILDDLKADSSTE